MNEGMNKKRILVVALAVLVSFLVLVPLGQFVKASPGWVSPTGFVDGGGVWTDEAITYDENIGTYAYADSLKRGWTDYLELTIDALNCNKVQVWVDHVFTTTNEIEVDVYYSGGWHNIFSGEPASWGAWNEYPVGSTQSITSMRIRFWASKAYIDECQVMEADFDEVSACTPNIDNSPISKEYGLVVENSTYETGLDYYSVTNNSGGAITITIQAVDFIGGNGWVLSDTATPDADTAGLKAGLEGGDYTIIIKKTPAYNTLVSGLANEATQKWGLKLYTPTSYSDGVQKSTTVTLTAICD